jgi:hypothetical protein
VPSSLRAGPGGRGGGRPAEADLAELGRVLHRRHLLVGGEDEDAVAHGRPGGLPRDVEHDPGRRVVAGLRSIWVADTGDETVTRIDARTGPRIARVSTKRPIEGALAASGGVAWAAGTNDVVRIQPVGSG